MSEQIIKTIIIQTGLSSDQIRALLKTDRESMNRLEKGKQALTTVQLRRLSNLLGCTEERLIKGLAGRESYLSNRINNLKIEKLEVIATVNKVAANLQILNGLRKI